MGLTYAGIDNGTSGAIAFIRDNNTVRLEKMPLVEVGKSIFIDELALQTILAEEEFPFTVFEQGQKNPLFGTKGNFANGMTYGVVQTVLRLSKCPHLCVNPKTWQKDVFKDMRGAGENTKGVAIEFCRRTFPSVNLVLPRCRKPDDGLADALCMAWWGRQRTSF